MHYVVIGKLLPWIREIFHLPKGDYTYWFPNSTRYIGYYPAGNDKTIHEFPSYSFVLGDLHAHVVNLMFVVALISLVYAMMQHYSGKNALQAEVTGNRNFIKPGSGSSDRSLCAGVCFSDRYVSLDELLGFCHLLCDGWHGSDLVQLPEL